MKGTLFDIILIFILSFVIYGCQKKEEHTKYENIVSVYFNNNSKWYQFIRKTDDPYQISSILVYGNDDYAQVKIINDVQENQKMWVYLIEHPSFSNKTIYLEIHVHNKKNNDIRKPQPPRRGFLIFDFKTAKHILAIVKK